MDADGVLSSLYLQSEAVPRRRRTPSPRKAKERPPTTRKTSSRTIRRTSRRLQKTQTLSRRRRRSRRRSPGRAQRGGRALGVRRRGPEARLLLRRSALLRGGRGPPLATVTTMMMHLWQLDLEGRTLWSTRTTQSTVSPASSSSRCACADGTLLDAVKSPNSSLQTVADDWIGSYESDPGPAMAELITFILRVRPRRLFVRDETDSLCSRADATR